jgi:hypothetical protein
MINTVCTEAESRVITLEAVGAKQAIANIIAGKFVL